jgi:hypothetical protein
MTACFAVFAECYRAIRAGVPIARETQRDKEFHFQNWFEARLTETGLTYERRGRNTYPDFVLVDRPEGYEIKGLAHPGRELNYDSNSQVPTGRHSGRDIYYVFGRYPNTEQSEYEVIDLIICHGSFLNADEEYIHRNRHVKAFGSYGDIMIRDRKMYVAPTPLALTTGTQGYATLITPVWLEHPDYVVRTGELVRVEANTLVVGYRFNLHTNTLTPEHVPNPNAGREHRFIAYRIAGDNERKVGLRSVEVVVNQQEALLDEEEV